MKQLLCILILFFSLNFYAQEGGLVLKSFVKKDSVLLRWAPASASILVAGLKNGFILERTNNKGGFENDSNPISYSITPFQNRKDLYTSTKEGIELTEFLSEFISSNDAQAKEMTYTFLMLGASTNRLLAEISGCFYIDAPVSDDQYWYRVRIPHTDYKSPAIQVNSTQLDITEAPTLFEGTAKPRLKQAYLSWEAKSHQTSHAGYWIERSTDSLHFITRNKNPYYFFRSQDEPNKSRCDFVDTNVTEGATYYYRITPINHFAERGKSTEIISVYVPKSIYGDVLIDSVFAEGTSRNIQGHFEPHRSNNEIKEIILFRSDSLLFGYKSIEKTEYKDSLFSFTSTVPLESGDRNYYKVAMVSPDHDTIYSFPYYFFTLDQIPPSAPQGLTGVMNDSGIVRLEWKPNAETDIRGYRVFRGNALYDEFIEVTRSFCVTSFFADTVSLNNLTPDIYYRIVAVDFNYNNSPYSEPVKIMKPDTIAPVAPFFNFYKIDSAGLSLGWINSSSKDVNNSMLLRKGKVGMDTLATWSDTLSVFRDETGVPGTDYQYFIVTADFADNRSVSDPLSLKFETGIRKGVSNLEGNANYEKKQIELNWTLPEGTIYAVHIYRAINDGKFTLFKTLRTDSLNSFVDTSLKINNRYSYKIKVVFQDGSSSGLSTVLQVTY